MAFSHESEGTDIQEPPVYVSERRPYVHEEVVRSYQPPLPPPGRPRRRDVFGPPAFFIGVIAIIAMGVALVMMNWDSTATDVDEFEEELLAAAAESVPGAAAGGVSPPEGMLRVEVEPAEASIYIDDRHSGEGPSHELWVEPGYRWVTIEMDGYGPLDTLVYVHADTPARLVAQLEPSAGAQRRASSAEPSAPRASQSSERAATASPSRSRASDRTATASSSRSEARSRAEVPAALQVVVDPRGAEIVLNGEVVGTTPFSWAEIAPGSYTLLARRDGYIPQQRTIVLRPGEDRRVAVVLDPEPVVTGTLSVTVRPWGSIYVNGERRASDTDVRFVTTMPVGTHRVRAVHPQLGASEVTVDVRADANASITIDLAP